MPSNSIELTPRTPLESHLARDPLEHCGQALSCLDDMEDILNNVEPEIYQQGLQAIGAIARLNTPQSV